MVERDWASLDGGPLYDVFTRLPDDVHALRFRRVCRGWRAGAGAGALVPRPWFILQSATDGHRAFVRPAGRHGPSRVRHVRFDPGCARGSSRGWLAVYDGGRLLLRDPISRAEVPLPSFDNPAYQLSDIFLSDDPLVAPDRWTAFAFFKLNNCDYAWQVLAFCRPGDAEWARFDQENNQQIGSYRGLEFFRGRAYVLLGMYRLAVCDVDTRRLVMSSVSLEYLELLEHVQVCLVECDGDLLAVSVSRYEYATSSYCVRHRIVRRFQARVVKIDFEEAGEGDCGMPVALSTWNVAKIESHALFVAPHGHAFALPAKDFPAVMPGCVYHFPTTNMTTNSVSGMVITELLDQDRAEQHKPLRKLPLTGVWRPLCWFLPRCPALLETTPARRRRRLHSS